MRRLLLAGAISASLLAACQLAYPTREAPEDGGVPSSSDAGTDVDAADAWPDETNTGPKGDLAPSGTLTITEPGKIVEGVDVTGTVSIQANDVTLRRCRVKSSSAVVVTIGDDIKGARIEDCEISGTGTPDAVGIYGPVSLFRSSVHDVQVAMELFGSDLTIADSYLWGLKPSEGSFHGIKADGDLRNITIRHNVIINDHDVTSAVMIDNYRGPVDGVTVDGNILAGGGFCIYSDGEQTAERVTGVRITNNRMRKGQYGYGSIRNNTVVQSGNVDDLTGAPIDF